MTIQVFRLFDQCSHTGSGFGVWGLAVSTARFSVSYSFAPFTRNRAIAARPDGGPTAPVIFAASRECIP